MKTRKTVPINPQVLKWAINESGYQKREFVSKLNIDSKILDQFIEGKAKPNITTFKKIARVLKRPTATFFLPEPPESSMPTVDFRYPTDENRTKINHSEANSLREVSRLQKILSWVSEELNYEKVKLEKVNISNHPEQCADYVRAFLEISSEKQLRTRDSSEAFNLWRKALQSKGIYIFLMQMGKDSSRGFSLWNEYAPIIAINTAWNTEARIFTIFHELGHLLTRQNSICMGISRQILSGKEDLEEKWCEHFAASLLLPWEALSKYLFQKFGYTNDYKITDINVVRSISKKFKLSMRATALRLIDKNRASWTLYNKIPSWSDKEKRGFGGGGQTRHQIKEKSFGQNTFKLMISAVNGDLISWSDALSYLDTTDSDLTEYELAK